MSTRGQVVIPKAVREALHIDAGDTLEIEVDNGRPAVIDLHSLLRIIHTSFDVSANTMC